MRLWSTFIVRELANGSNARPPEGLHAVLLHSESARLDLYISTDDPLMPVSDIILLHAGRISQRDLRTRPGDLHSSIRLRI